MIIHNKIIRPENTEIMEQRERSCSFMMEVIDSAIPKRPKRAMIGVGSGKPIADNFKAMKSKNNPVDA